MGSGSGDALRGKGEMMGDSSLVRCRRCWIRATKVVTLRTICDSNWILRRIKEGTLLSLSHFKSWVHSKRYQEATA